MARRVSIITRGTGWVGALLLGKTNPILIFAGAGAPVDGTTGAGDARQGSEYTDEDSGVKYLNTGTKAVPVWSATGGGSGASAGGSGLTEVHNDTGGALAAGDLVYVSGWNETSKLSTVAKADADLPRGAAVLVIREAIANGATGLAGKTYRLTAQNTVAANAVGDPVYLSATAGGWTLTQPAATRHVQIVGRVAVDHASAGVVEFNIEPPIVGIVRHSIIAGGAAGALALAGVAVGDRLISVTRADVAVDTGTSATGNKVAGLTDITAEFTVSGANAIDNTAGTDTTGDTLLIAWLDLT